MLIIFILISKYFFDKSLDAACDICTFKFLEFAKRCIPRKPVTIRQHDKPWFNSELRLELRKINRLHKIARKYNRPIGINEYIEDILFLLMNNVYISSRGVEYLYFSLYSIYYIFNRLFSFAIKAACPMQ